MHVYLESFRGLNSPCGVMYDQCGRRAEKSVSKPSNCHKNNNWMRRHLVHAVEADLAGQWEMISTMHGDVRWLPRDDHTCQSSMRHVSSSLLISVRNPTVRTCDCGFMNEDVDTCLESGATDDCEDAKRIAPRNLTSTRVLRVTETKIFESDLSRPGRHAVSGYGTQLGNATCQYHLYRREGNPPLTC
jgi:hypothetical protein